MAAARVDDVRTESSSGSESEEPLQDELEVGSIVAGKYEIRRMLGEGGMGTVYAARHQLSGRRVALKWVDPGTAKAKGLLDRFVREARAMGRIDHPNVVGVFDAGIDQDAAYLTMELLHGEPLRELIDRDAPIHPAKAIALLMPAMEGVEAAHRVKVVHRDIKPDNLFVVRRRNGSILTTKVLDFGISKLGERHNAPVTAVTQAGSVIGTPHYMSPEQARGTLIDDRTDIWALGVILYEMIAAQAPFDGENYGQIILALATDEPRPLDELVPGIDPGLVEVVEKALAKNPRDRWQSVHEMARELERFCPDVRFEEPIASLSDFPPAPDGRASVPASPNAMRKPRVSPDALTRPAGSFAIEQELETEEEEEPHAEAIIAASESEPPHPPRHRRAAWIGAAIVLAGLVGGAAMLASDAESTPPTATTESPEEHPTEALPIDLPEQASDASVEPTPSGGGSLAEAPAPSGGPLTESEVTEPNPTPTADPPRRRRRSGQRGSRQVTQAPVPRGRSGILSREEF